MTIVMFCCFFLFFGETFSFYQNIPEEKELHSHIPLSKKYHLIGKGAQCLAFESEDGQTVLKLFKAHHHFPRISRAFKLLISPSFRRECEQRWDKKFRKTADCYEMAFAHLKKETGLLDLHLKKTEGLDLSVELHDGAKKVVLDLNSYPYIVQKKALLLPEHLKNLSEKHEYAKMRIALNSVRKLFEERTKKGFSDRRQSLRINYGFVDGEAIQLDPGKIFENQDLRLNSAPEIERLNQRLDQWIKKYFPEF